MRAKLLQIDECVFCKHVAYEFPKVLCGYYAGDYHTVCEVNRDSDYRVPIPEWCPLPDAE